MNEILRRYIDALQTARLSPSVIECALEPADPTAPLSPVVDVVLVPKAVFVNIHDDVVDGSACSSSCGFCGRCTDGVNTNCLCQDCGGAFWKGPEDCDSFCDSCRDVRDAHTTALELRMARAAIAADVKKEVA